VAIFNDIEAEESRGDPATSVALASLAAVDVAATAAPALPVDALQRLPELGAGGGDPYWHLVSAFLVGYPPHSSRAYFGDLKGWYAWCAGASVPSAAGAPPSRRRLGPLSLRDPAASDRPAGVAGVDRQAPVVPEQGSTTTTSATRSCSSSHPAPTPP